jgi:CPA1 family monovalent cation:H+ antiporter
MRIKDVLEMKYSVFTLSVVSLGVSMFLIAIGLYFLLPLFGVAIPFVGLLMFGALISATDPVAVLALFKELGAPKRITLLFEGESIFNDGTSVAAFSVVLSMALSGVISLTSFSFGVLEFLFMCIGGGVFGYIFGKITNKVLYFYKNVPEIVFTLCIIAAHSTFVLAEVLSQYLHFAGKTFHISAIIATAIAAMIVGDFAHKHLPQDTKAQIDGAVSYVVFIINSLVFILMGIFFANTNVPFMVLFAPILLAVVIVALSRAISVYSVIIPFNYLQIEAKIPANYQHLLSWGSLRGALAVIMCLLIPTTLTFPGWTEEYSVRDFLTALTIGCVYFTLIFKATTIEGLMKKLKIIK